MGVRQTHSSVKDQKSGPNVMVVHAVHKITLFVQTRQCVKIST